MTDQATTTAEQRADWAHEGTRLAMDRTFAAFIRTALSFMGFGIAVAKLLPDLNPPWIAQAIGILLIVGGITTALRGAQTAHNVIHEVSPGGRQGAALVRHHQYADSVGHCGRRPAGCGVGLIDSTG